MVRRLRFERPMSRPVAMPQGAIFLLHTGRQASVSIVHVALVLSVSDRMRRARPKRLLRLPPAACRQFHAALRPVRPHPLKPAVPSLALASDPVSSSHLSVPTLPSLPSPVKTIPGQNSRIIRRLRPRLRPQSLEEAHGECCETPLHEHVYRGDEERVREVVVVGREHPFVCFARARGVGAWSAWWAMWRGAAARRARYRRARCEVWAGPRGG